MNGVFNGKARELTGFEEVFVSSSPDGSGTLVGAALYLHAQRTQERSLHVPDQLLGAGLQR